MASRQEARQEIIEPRLYLVTEPVSDAKAFVPSLERALAAADVAAVLLRLPPGRERRSLARIVDILTPAVQDAGAALILDGEPELALQCGADGSHLTGIEAVNASVDRLKPKFIAGAGGLKTRHDAMIAGEKGCDYVMFGEPDAAFQRPAFASVIERVAWWSELFEVPCVGYAASMEEVRPLAQAGAEFIALGDFVWKAGADPGSAISEAARHLRRTELV